jgi:hypothetical protein
MNRRAANSAACYAFTSGASAVLAGYAALDAKWILLALTAGLCACGLRLMGLALDGVQEREPSAYRGKVWPFVESPGELADRIGGYLRENGGYVLGALRRAFIEEPAAIRSPEAARAFHASQLAAAQADAPTTVAQRVAAAQAEMAGWSDERRANVRLEGQADAPEGER